MQSQPPGIPSEPAVDVRRDGRVSIVTLNRPTRRNAVDGPTAEALTAAFVAFAADDTLDVAVLTGAGGQFCAGADLQAFASGQATNRVEADGDGPMGPTRMVLGKPVIAAIEGHAVAGGLELALWADLRIVARSATLGVFCRRWGVPLIDGGTARLPALIGLSRALDLILTGRAVAADEALQIGLANRVVEDGAALETAVALAHELCALPQAALRGDRLAAIEGVGLPTAQAMSNEFRHGLASLAGEAQDGARRFAGGAGRHGAPAPLMTSQSSARSDSGSEASP